MVQNQKKLGLKTVGFQDEFLQCKRDSTKGAILQLHEF